MRGGTPGKVEVLLDAGADISYQTEMGTNILIRAMYSQAMSEGKLLLPLVELLLARAAPRSWGKAIGANPLIVRPKHLDLATHRSLRQRE